MRVIAYSTLLLLLAGFAAHAQNYSISGTSVFSVITATSTGSGGYTYAATSTGGTVTANSSATAGQTASTQCTIKFAVTVVDNVLPATPQGYVYASDNATGNGSATNGSAYAYSGYDYSPWLSLHDGITTGSSASYSHNWTYPTGTPGYADIMGNTTLYVTATANTSARGFMGGSASAYSDSVATLSVN